eukprot:jgi/Phyca11/121435/e_gw1.44.53.1
MLEADYSGCVLSFDGAAKTQTSLGSCGCILWEQPGWNVLEAQGFTLTDVTVNDGLKMALRRGVQELVVVGDSRIAIQQVQGIINCNQPNSQRRLAEVESLTDKFRILRLVHVKRKYNQAADYLTSKTLVMGKSWQVEDADEFTHLRLVSKIHEKLMKPHASENPNAQVSEIHESQNHTTEEQAPGSTCATLSLAAKAKIVHKPRMKSSSEISWGRSSSKQDGGGGSRRTRTKTLI